jgi:nucleotide-binding universal stress UspA family protein
MARHCRQSRPGWDAGPVLVAVDARPGSWDALEWAAAEAAARACALRIVHAVAWPREVLDPFGGAAGSPWDLAAQRAAELVLDEAAGRARAVEPALAVTTHLAAGPAASAVLREGRRDALIVVGASHRADRRGPLRAGSVSWPVAHRASGPVVVVELSGPVSRGPSAGRVVVGPGGPAQPAGVLGFAFRAARRRGAGLTALHAGTGAGPVAGDAWITDALRPWRAAFPDVPVIERVVAGPAGPALAAESAGAALLVIGAGPGGRWRRSARSPELRAAVLLARCPVAIVRIPSRRRGDASPVRPAAGRPAAGRPAGPAGGRDRGSAAGSGPRPG